MLVTLPPTIDSTGNTDVTAEVEAFINAQPDGTTIVFPVGTYRFGRTVQVNRSGIRIEGSGSTLEPPPT